MSPMCNRYTPPTELDIERLWHIGVHNQQRWWEPVLAPLWKGPYLKPGGELEVGQWGMIPPRSKTHVPTTADGRRMSTNNARTESVGSTWTYAGPWKAGQRCLIPAQSYVEPYWGHRNKNIFWQFERADGLPWALAGIWILRPARPTSKVTRANCFRPSVKKPAWGELFFRGAALRRLGCSLGEQLSQSGLIKYHRPVSEIACSLKLLTTNRGLALRNSEYGTKFLFNTVFHLD